MLLNRTIGPRVVHILVNLPARTILLMIHLSAFLRRESAAVCSAVVAHFAIDIGLAIFQMAALTRSQLPGLLTACDSRLLVPFPSVDAAHRRCFRLAVIL